MGIGTSQATWGWDADYDHEVFIDGGSDLAEMIPRLGQPNTFYLQLTLPCEDVLSGQESFLFLIESAQAREPWMIHGRGHYNWLMVGRLEGVPVVVNIIFFGDEEEDRFGVFLMETSSDPQYTDRYQQFQERARHCGMAVARRAAYATFESFSFVPRFPQVERPADRAAMGG